MDRLLSVSEARARLPAVLDEVEGGDEITITRHGRPVAVIVRPDVLRTRRADAALAVAQHVEERLARARSSRIPGRGISSRRAQELLTEIRTGRVQR